METQIVKIKYDRSKLLGKGSFGSVFVGSFEGIEIAVKRIELSDDIQIEDEIIRCLDHPNVIKLFAIEESYDFRYYAFELATATLNDFCQDKYQGAMPSYCEGLRQMAAGLMYIHSMNVVHRDIKPSNVLISTTRNESVRLMIADFGLCKKTTIGGSFSIGSGKKGTEGWMAPEIVRSYYDDDYDSDNTIQTRLLKRFSIASDIWALGCLFFYFLTKGIHPFGKSLMKMCINILWGDPDELDRILKYSSEETVEIYKLIRDMINKEPEKRSSLSQVIEKLKRQMSGNDSKAGDGLGNDQRRPGNTEITDGARTVEKTAQTEEMASDPNIRASDDKDKAAEEQVKLAKDCCVYCKKILNELDKRTGRTENKIGYLNESAIRTNLDSKEAGKTRSIKTLYQLIKCYGEAKEKMWTEEDTYKSCKRVIDELKKKESAENYNSWCRKKAKEEKNENAAQQNNYIPVPMENWDEFSNIFKPKSPIFLLALYESIKDHDGLLSFPQPGEMTMDVPVKISWGKTPNSGNYTQNCTNPTVPNGEISTVLIEVGEIISRDEDIEKAKLKLRRSLLCFKWLDQVISQVHSFYGLIGNIYTNDKNLQLKQPKIEFPGDGITFKTSYVEYK